MSEDPRRLTESEVQARVSEIRTGTHARTLLENPAFAAAFKQIQDEIVAKFLEAPLRDSEGLMTLRLMSQVAEGFKQRLMDMLESSTMAEAQLKAHKAAGGEDTR